MAAFNDYLDLKVAVADHVGNRNISDVMNRLTLAAEAWLNQKLRAREQITPLTTTFASGVATLPTDYLEMVAVYDTTGRYAMTQGTLQSVKQISSPYWTYAIDGTTLHIYGYTGGRNIEYYAALPTLTTSLSTTNWLLTKYPNVYLYAVGLEAAKFLRDTELVQVTGQLLEGAMRDLKINDDRALWGNAAARPQMIMP